MSKRGPEEALTAAREALVNRLDFDAFLAKLSPKDRVNAERRVGVLEAEPDPARARLWRRLACALMTLSPQSAKLVGRQTIQFYIADGKYRMQVFALEDLQDGNFTIYCPDILNEATAAGLVSEAPEPAAPFRLIGRTREPLAIESLDRDSLNPGAHYKDLLGWNRKALRILLPPSASPLQIETTELLCAIAANHFVVAKPVNEPASGK
jgi:hypothetical protein